MPICPGGVPGVTTDQGREFDGDSPRSAVRPGRPASHGRPSTPECPDSGCRRHGLDNGRLRQQLPGVRLNPAADRRHRAVECHGVNGGSRDFPSALHLDLARGADQRLPLRRDSQRGRHRACPGRAADAGSGLGFVYSRRLSQFPSEADGVVPVEVRLHNYTSGFSLNVTEDFYLSADSDGLYPNLLAMSPGFSCAPTPASDKKQPTEAMRPGPGRSPAGGLLRMPVRLSSPATSSWRAITPRTIPPATAACSTGRY